MSVFLLATIFSLIEELKFYQISINPRPTPTTNKKKKNYKIKFASNLALEIN